MKRYLFKNSNNGFYITYHPFEVAESLSQKKSEEYILISNPAAPRIGSCVENILETLDKKSIKFKQYKYCYYKPEEEASKSILENKIDPLPECMYLWDVIEGITGNY